MRIAVDTKVLISGIFWHGIPGQVLDAAEQGKCSIVSSEALVTELLDVLEREKFAKRLQVLD